jgi:hypothetical protein
VTAELKRIAGRNFGDTHGKAWDQYYNLNLWTTHQCCQRSRRRIPLPNLSLQRHYCAHAARPGFNLAVHVIAALARLPGAYPRLPPRRPMPRASLRPPLLPRDLLTARARCPWRTAALLLPSRLRHTSHFLNTPFLHVLSAPASH